MKIISGGRASGKTYKLVEMVKADPEAILVCRTHEMAQHITEMYGLNKSQVVSTQAVEKGDLDGASYNLYVDDVRDELSPKLYDNHWVKAISVDPNLDAAYPGSLDDQIRIMEWYVERLKAQKVERDSKLD